MTDTRFPGERGGSDGLTIEEVLRLPASVDLTTAGRALGFGRTKAYALVRAGAFPCRVIRVGEVYRVPTAEILALLGIDPASIANGRGRGVAGDGDA